MNEKTQEIEKLWVETQKAHHKAYHETDGFDPEWPLWYADYLIDKLPALLEAEMTKSELVFLIVHLSKIQPLEAPGANWSRFYAWYLAQRYL